MRAAWLFNMEGLVPFDCMSMAEWFSCENYFTPALKVVVLRWAPEGRVPEGRGSRHQNYYAYDNPFS